MTNRLRVFVLIIAALALPIVAQDANVIELDQPEMTEARLIDAAQHRLDARREELKVRIVRNHLEAPMGQASGCVLRQMVVKSAWGCGEFQYTSDFRFIVPDPNHSTGFNSERYYEIVNGVATPIKAEENR